MLGSRDMVLKTDCQYDIRIAYSSVHSITTFPEPNPTITFTLLQAPYMSEIRSTDDVTQMLSLLSFGNNKSGSVATYRVPDLGDEHASVVAGCLLYRIYVARDCYTDILHTLRKVRDLPDSIRQRVPIRLINYKTTGDYVEAHDLAMRRLKRALMTTYNILPFAVTFQLQKLAQNGYLPPYKVITLLPKVHQMQVRSGPLITSSAVRLLFKQLPFPGPETDAIEFHIDTLTQMIKDNEERLKREDLYQGHPTRNDTSNDTTLVYRASVTPAGIYLYGPEPESKNRVLRKYANHSDYFLRVVFCDEDNEQIRYNNRVSNDEIFYERFRTILQDGFDVCGRRYQFLGFSHSSLRSQSCWFMAPFVQDGTLVHDRMVIRD